MLSIVICDDQKDDLTSLQSLFQKSDFDLDYHIHTFINESDMYQAFDSGLVPNLLFLDIELTNTTGIAIAEEIRQRFGASPLIVFVSSYPDYVFSVFQVSPFDFFRKPLTSENLSPLLERLQRYFKSQTGRIIEVKDRNIKESHYINCQDIYFFEMVNSAQRLLQITTKQTTIETYSRLGDFASKLPANDFCQIYRSIFIQLSCVRGLAKDSVILEHDIHLPVGKKYANTLRNRLLKREES